MNGTREISGNNNGGEENSHNDNDSNGINPGLRLGATIGLPIAIALMSFGIYCLIRMRADNFSDDESVNIVNQIAKSFNATAGEVQSTFSKTFYYMAGNATEQLFGRDHIRIAVSNFFYENQSIPHMRHKRQGISSLVWGFFIFEFAAMMFLLPLLRCIRTGNEQPRSVELEEIRQTATTQVSSNALQDTAQADADAQSALQTTTQEIASESEPETDFSPLRLNDQLGSVSSNRIVNFVNRHRNLISAVSPRAQIGILTGILVAAGILAMGFYGDNMPIVHQTNRDGDLSAILQFGEQVNCTIIDFARILEDSLIACLGSIEEQASNSARLRRFANAHDNFQYPSEEGEVLAIIGHIGFAPLGLGAGLGASLLSWIIGRIRDHYAERRAASSSTTTDVYRSLGTSSDTVVSSTQVQQSEIEMNEIAASPTPVNVETVEQAAMQTNDQPVVHSGPGSSMTG